MMNQVTHVSQDQFETLLKRLSRLEKMMAMLLKKEEPPKGTDEWWEWSDKKALEGIKRGEYKEFKSAKEMVTYLEKLSAK